MEIKSQLKLTPLQGSTSRKKVHKIEFKTNTQFMKSTTEKPRVTKYGNVKAHLFKVGHITSLEAINLYNATRLSAIIYRLRWDDKLTIKSEDVKQKDCNGNTVVFSKYVLITKKDK